MKRSASGSASLHGRRRRTATSFDKSSASPGGDRSPLPSGRSRGKTPSPGSLHRLLPAQGADGNPRSALWPRAREPLLIGEMAVHNGQRRVYRTESAAVTRRGGDGMGNMGKGAATAAAQ